MRAPRVASASRASANSGHGPRRLAQLRALFFAQASLLFVYATTTEYRAKYLTGLRLANWALLLACMRFAAGIADFVKQVALCEERRAPSSHCVPEWTAFRRASWALGDCAIPFLLAALQEEVVDDRVTTTLVALVACLVLCVADSALSSHPAANLLWCTRTSAPGAFVRALLPLALLGLWAACTAVARWRLGDGDPLQYFLPGTVLAAGVVHASLKDLLGARASGARTSVPRKGSRRT